MTDTKPPSVEAMEAVKKIFTEHAHITFKINAAKVLDAFAADARRTAIEECASLLNTEANEIKYNQYDLRGRDKAYALEHYARSIRALADKPAASKEIAA